MCVFDRYEKFDPPPTSKRQHEANHPQEKRNNPPQAKAMMKKVRKVMVKEDTNLTGKRRNHENERRLKGEKKSDRHKKDAWDAIFVVEKHNRRLRERSKPHSVTGRPRGTSDSGMTISYEGPLQTAASHTFAQGSLPAVPPLPRAR